MSGANNYFPNFRILAAPQCRLVRNRSRPKAKLDYVLDVTHDGDAFRFAKMSALSFAR